MTNAKVSLCMLKQRYNKIIQFRKIVWKIYSICSHFYFLSFLSHEFCLSFELKWAENIPGRFSSNRDTSWEMEIYRNLLWFHWRLNHLLTNVNWVEVHNAHTVHSNHLNPMGRSNKISFGTLWLTTEDQNILCDTECKEGIKELLFLSNMFQCFALSISIIFI